VGWSENEVEMKGGGKVTGGRLESCGLRDKISKRRKYEI
jgi:hypothetical protein